MSGHNEREEAAAKLNCAGALGAVERAAADLRQRLQEGRAADFAAVSADLLWAARSLRRDGKRWKQAAEAAGEGG